MMKLSEAIRLGSMLSAQAHWRFRGATDVSAPGDVLGLRGTQSSCALGAAHDAIGTSTRRIITTGRESVIRGGTPPPGIEVEAFESPAEWTVLLATPQRCPECGQQGDLRQLIVHLNDEHRWTRPRIADFVEEAESGSVRDAQSLEVTRAAYRRAALQRLLIKHPLP